MQEGLEYKVHELLESTFIFSVNTREPVWVQCLNDENDLTIKPLPLETALLVMEIKGLIEDYMHDYWNG